MYEYKTPELQPNAKSSIRMKRYFEMGLKNIKDY